MPSPLLWGDKSTVRDRLGSQVSDLRIRRRMLHFDYPMRPADLVLHYVEHFGPTRNAHRGLDAEARKRFERDLVDLWSSRNQAGNGTTRVDGEILEIVAVR